MSEYRKGENLGTHRKMTGILFRFETRFWTSRVGVDLGRGQNEREGRGKGHTVDVSKDGTSTDESDGTPVTVDEKGDGLHE